jgi:cobyrinic acid a,c-diamide synthase
VGSELRGHEIHYSRIVRWDGSDADLALGMRRGVGFANRRDGIRYKNVLALYTHIHARGTPQWAPALVAAARAWQRKTGPAKQMFAGPVK